MAASRIALAAALAVLFGTASAGAAESEISAGPPAADKTVPFRVFFPLTNKAALEQFLADAVNPAKPDVYHHWLTPAQFKDAYGPAPSSVAAVEAELTRAGMTVTARHTQDLEVAGPAHSIESMFGIHLNTMRSISTGLERNVALEGHTTLPASFTAVGAHVVGFESHIIAQVHSQRVKLDPGNIPAARLNIAPATQAYFLNDMKAAYSFPSFQTYSKGTGLANYTQIVGLGTNIGILMSSIALNSDLQLQLNSIVTLNSGQVITQNYTPNSNLPVPSFVIREVSGGSGPFGNFAADEASLDTQNSLGTAQGATEELYDIPDLSDGSILAGYDAIVEDNTVDVVSSSFGGDENLEVVPNPFNGFISEGFVLDLLDQEFLQGNAQGITFVASSGDHGSLPTTDDFSAGGYIGSGGTGTSPAAPGTQFPADDPNVTGVGGTNLATTQTAAQQDTYVEENEFGDPLVSPFAVFGGSGGLTGMYWGSGGGVSIFFPKPAYQNLVSTRNATQRTVPDIALQMGGCPGGILTNAEAAFCNTQERSFTLTVIGGELFGLIGTSSSSPQFAGVLAHLIELSGGGSGFNVPGPGQPNAPIGRLGNVNTLIYTLAATQIAAGGPLAPPNLQYYNRRIQGFTGFWGNDTDLAYSYVLGVGTPNVTNFLGLQGAVVAGNPGTLTNP
jgi:subtilase family serine protease